MTSSKEIKKPKLEFFSKRVGGLTLLLAGGAYYWFAYRLWSRKRRHHELELEAQTYWQLQNKNKGNQGD